MLITMKPQSRLPAFQSILFVLGFRLMEQAELLGDSFLLWPMESLELGTPNWTVFSIKAAWEKPSQATKKPKVDFLIVLET